MALKSRFRLPIFLHNYPSPPYLAQLLDSNLDSDGVEDRADHKARATSIGLAPAFLFKPEMPGFEGQLASYSDGACVPLPVAWPLLSSLVIYVSAATCT